MEDSTGTGKLETNRLIQVGILVVNRSDDVINDATVDGSGANLKNLVVDKLSAAVNCYDVVLDNRQAIKSVLQYWVDNRMLDVIFTVGGIGFTPDDCTPEATRDLIDKESTGLQVAMLMRLIEVTPLAMLYRPVCGVRGNTLIINFPSNLEVSEKCFNIVAPVINLIIDMLHGVKTSAEVEGLLLKNVSKKLWVALQASDTTLISNMAQTSNNSNGDSLQNQLSQKSPRRSLLNSLPVLDISGNFCQLQTSDNPTQTSSRLLTGSSNKLLPRSVIETLCNRNDIKDSKPPDLLSNPPVPELSKASTSTSGPGSALATIDQSMLMQLTQNSGLMMQQAATSSMSIGRISPQKIYNPSSSAFNNILTSSSCGNQVAYGVNPNGGSTNESFITLDALEDPPSVILRSDDDVTTGALTITGDSLPVPMKQPTHTPSWCSRRKFAPHEAIRKRRVFGGEGDRYRIPVGKDLRRFLLQEHRLQDITLQRGKRNVKRDLVKLNRQEDAIDRNMWKRGKNLSARCRYDDLFELTEKGKQMRFLIAVGKGRDEFVVAWYLWCPGQGNCKRKCGGLGACMEGCKGRLHKQDRHNCSLLVTLKLYLSDLEHWGVEMSGCHVPEGVNWVPPPPAKLKLDEDVRDIIYDGVDNNATPEMVLRQLLSKCSGKYLPSLQQISITMSFRKQSLRLRDNRGTGGFLHSLSGNSSGRIPDADYFDGESMLCKSPKSSSNNFINHNYSNMTPMNAFASQAGNQARSKPRLIAPKPYAQTADAQTPTAGGGVPQQPIQLSNTQGLTMGAAMPLQAIPLGQVIFHPMNTFQNNTTAFPFAMPQQQQIYPQTPQYTQPQSLAGDAIFQQNLVPQVFTQMNNYAAPMLQPKSQLATETLPSNYSGGLTDCGVALTDGGKHIGLNESNKNATPTRKAEELLKAAPIPSPATQSASMMQLPETADIDGHTSDQITSMFEQIARALAVDNCEFETDEVLGETRVVSPGGLREPQSEEDGVNCGKLVVNDRPDESSTQPVALSNTNGVEKGNSSSEINPTSLPNSNDVTSALGFILSDDEDTTPKNSDRDEDNRASKSRSRSPRAPSFVRTYPLRKENLNMTSFATVPFLPENQQIYTKKIQDSQKASRSIDGIPSPNKRKRVDKQQSNTSSVDLKRGDKGLKRPQDQSCSSDQRNNSKKFKSVTSKSVAPSLRFKVAEVESSQDSSSDNTQTAELGCQTPWEGEDEGSPAGCSSGSGKARRSGGAKKPLSGKSRVKATRRKRGVPSRPTGKRGGNTPFYPPAVPVDSSKSIYSDRIMRPVIFELAHSVENLRRNQLEMWHYQQGGRRGSESQPTESASKKSRASRYSPRGANPVKFPVPGKKQKLSKSALDAFIGKNSGHLQGNETVETTQLFSKLRGSVLPAGKSGSFSAGRNSGNIFSASTSRQFSDSPKASFSSRRLVSPTSSSFSSRRLHQLSSNMVDVELSASSSDDSDLDLLRRDDVSDDDSLDSSSDDDDDDSDLDDSDSVDDDSSSSSFDGNVPMGRSGSVKNYSYWI